MIGEILKKIFGDKNAKDKKLYWPYVEQALDLEEQIKKLSDDELRAKTTGFKELIQEEKLSIENEKNQLQIEADDLETPIENKENLFDKIDKLEKAIDEQIELSLLKILPESFAVVKETAFRWSNNGQLLVSATDFDRELAVKKDGITIKGDQAIWHN